MAKKVVLAGACRTAIGTMGGGLSTVPAADLDTQIFDMRKAATSIRELLAQRYLTTILKLYLCIQNLSDKNCRCAI